MKFSKMHGIGNDYVYVNCFKEKVTDPEKVSIIVSDRRKGIGSDGLILISPSEVADCKMNIYNADGSEAMMCGNGIRCVAKYAYDNHIVNSEEFSIETKSGIKTIKVTVENGVVTSALVNMGKAIIEPKKIPILAAGDSFINQPIEVDGITYNVTCVSMGNPHCITYVDDVDSLDLEKIGPGFENHKLFPDRINTEFIKVINDTTLQMRVWERGSGETFACGTGACASVVSSILNGYCKKDVPITVNLVGGSLTITWLSDGTVMMDGSATHVFDGEINIEQ